MLERELFDAYDTTRDRVTDRRVVCHAPFLNLNFEQNGNATACCYNRTHVLGSYPRDSVAEIWHGSRARELREAIEQHDFSKGCELCLVQLQSRNFTGTRMRHFDSYSAAPAGEVPLPRVMEFELTNTCNLECVMCTGYYSSLIRKHREQLPPLRNPYDAAFVEQLEPFLPGLLEAKFLGGEPFLIKRYFEIWERLRRRNPGAAVIVTTNGSVLNEKVRGVLDALDVRLVLSIDSVERASYEAIRKNADYGAVMANLDFFLDYMRAKRERLRMTVCPMQQNWRELPGLVGFCDARGIEVFFNTVLYPASCSLRDLPAAELAAVVDHLRGAEPLADAAARGPDEPWRIHNRERLRDLVHQLEEWLQIAREKQAVRARLGDAGANKLHPERWALKLYDDARASLVRSAQDPDALRVELEQAGAGDAWKVQLVQGGLSLRRDVRYCVSFRARAARPRPVTAVVAQAHEPWRQLGLYRELELGDEWDTHYLYFVATETTEQSRLYFDLAASNAAVELGDLVIVEGGPASTTLFEARYQV